MRKLALASGLTLALVMTMASQTQPPRAFVDPALLTRINKVVGFDSERVQRHFYVLKNGGAIEVLANDANDAATIKAIQSYLKKESELYTKGNFENASAMYGKAPDGTITLKKLRDDVSFVMVPEENGAVLRMLTVNPQAKNAIHDYLKYQIDQLKTGDPTAPQD